MRLKTQPEGSKTCGQHCVAMIADISVAESIATFNSRAATSTKKVAAALQKLGYPAQNKLIRFKEQEELPMLCILKLRWTGTNTGHWVVYNAGIVYDPAFGKYRYSLKKFQEIGATPRFYLRVR
jgi:ABC-type bacteriocin/lantibiotic exporter with double-glycine peptidase domain